MQELLEALQGTGTQRTLNTRIRRGWGEFTSLLRMHLDWRRQRAIAHRLRESEQLLRATIEHAPYGITVRNRTGELLLFNTAWMKIWALSEAEVWAGDAGSRDLPFEERYPHLAAYRESIQEVFDSGGELHMAELRVDRQRPSGAGWVSQYLYALKDEHGRVEKVVTITQDITERKRAEAVRHAVYRISEAANLTSDVQELFSSIHASMMLLMPADNFYLALYDEENDLISFPYFVDQHDPPPAPKKPGKGLTEYVLATGRPLLITEDVFQDLIERGEVELIGTPSIDWMGVPLRVGERVIGVAGLQSFRENVRYTPDDLDMLRFVSDQIAMAIERRRTEDQLKFLSHHDALTGLYNRAFFEAEMVKLSRMPERPVTIVVADMDRLKHVNDTCGHPAGDEALRQAARLLRSAFRKDDLIARIGGDEFAVVLPHTGQEEAASLLCRARRLLQIHNQGSGDRPLAISFGLACGLTGPAVMEIVRRADEAMYREKRLRA